MPDYFLRREGLCLFDAAGRNHILDRASKDARCVSWFGKGPPPKFKCPERNSRPIKKVPDKRAGRFSGRSINRPGGAYGFGCASSKMKKRRNRAEGRQAWGTTHGCLSDSPHIVPPTNPLTLRAQCQNSANQNDGRSPNVIPDAREKKL